MSDLTTRLSKAVWEYLDTANLRSEPFSLSRIEEVIAGVMATDSKVPVLKATGYVNAFGIPIKRDETKPRLVGIEALEERVEAARKRHADFMERYAQLQEPTAPVTYDLSKDPDAFKKAKVGDIVICEIGKDLVGYGDHQKWSCHRIMNSECNHWTRIA